MENCGVIKEEEGVNIVGRLRRKKRNNKREEKLRKTVAVLVGNDFTVENAQVAEETIVLRCIPKRKKVRFKSKKDS